MPVSAPPPSLREVLEAVARSHPVSLPVLVAVNEDAGAAIGGGSITGGTRALTAPLACDAGDLSQLADNSCLVVDGFARPAAGVLRLTIGRSRRCDYRINDDSVSALHALLYFDRERYEFSLADASSLNGTFVNGARSAPEKRVTIWAGALLGFGHAVFCFVDPPTLRQLASLR